MEQKTRSRIEEYLKEHDGIVRTSVFQDDGFHNIYLSELVEEGYLVRIKAGLYLMAEKQSVAGFFETQLALPSAVICLASALSFYELTTYEPPSVHIAIPRDDKTLPPEYPPVKTFSFGNTRYNLGITRIELEGKDIAMYDREKTICDCIRYRRVLGQDIVNEAFRNYMDSQKTNIDKLIQYSRILKSEGPVQNHLRYVS
jgi:predicted transcriptional regulator of viral defense system